MRIAVLAALAALGCSGAEGMAPAGQEHGADHRTGQDLGPIREIGMYLDGFHFYADDLGRQIEAHHYCSMLGEGFFQCLVYDGDRPGSRLIGVEYVISEDRFRRLPEEEKRYWHSHAYEVTSGQLTLPGVPAAKETEVMKQLVSTYGKTWHFWQVDRGDEMPLGIPRLMMGFTGDGQAKADLLRQRDRRLRVSVKELMERRRDIRAPRIEPGADAWQDGDTVQLAEEIVPVRNLPARRQP